MELHIVDHGYQESVSLLCIWVPRTEAGFLDQAIWSRDEVLCLTSFVVDASEGVKPLV